MRLLAVIYLLCPQRIMPGNDSNESSQADGPTDLDLASPLIEPFNDMKTSNEKILIRIF